VNDGGLAYIVIWLPSEVSSVGASQLRRAELGLGGRSRYLGFWLAELRTELGVVSCAINLW